MEKKIIIEGKNNRYQINKLLKINKEQEKKNTDDIEDKYYDSNEQMNIINGIYKPIDSYLENTIKMKINGYKQQDKLKCIFEEDKFIQYTEVISLLKENSCKCFYCKVPLLIFYKVKNDGDQWTLDRIDNSQGHNTGNVVTSCLDCNIQKKDKNHDKFLYSKNLTIKKL